MGTNYKSGFTIIETMLFLAITGLMVVAILVNTGSTINIQRYRDSVISLKSFLQGQYSDVMNVRNEQPAAPLSCDNNAKITESGTTSPRGQADCVILGKYTTIVDTKISSSVVVGLGDISSTANDIDNLKTYKLSILPGSTETSDLEWGTNIAWPKSGIDNKGQSTPRTIALLMLRSPSSGLSYTFSADSANISLSDMIVAGDTIPGQAQRLICVDPAGLFSGGQSIYINSYATGSSSIETKSNDTSGTSQC